MKTSYRERDYASGSAILTLRTKIGLTQAELASHLGISRRAVGEWEAGSSYPKPEHLKELITLAVKQRAFGKGSAVEEIHALWRAAHQKVLLDECWLSALLEHSRSPSLHIVPKPTEESMIVETVQTCGARHTGYSACPPVMAEVPPLPRVDWGDALAAPIFYGREQEQAQLTQWVVQERCRVVSVLGMGGIGKSVLSAGLMYRLAEHFQVVIFRSLRDAPPCEALLDGCLQVLSPQHLSVSSAGQAQGTISTERRIILLLEQMRETRTLLVLDNLESLLQEGDPGGHFRPDFEGYGQLLRRVAEAMHQSCLLITSREKPAVLRPLEGKHSLVHSLRLSGLGLAACKQLCVEKELVGTEADQERLIALYGGNPLALKIVAETIIDLFSGEIGPFLGSEALVFGSISDLLGEQFARLSALEQSVLYWLAIAREPMTLDELQALLVIPLPRFQVLEALDGLHRCSLIERGKRLGSFTLQSVVLEYVTGILVAEGSREIKLGCLQRLIEHGLSQARASEYVRKSQERLLVVPLLADLQSAIGWGQGPPLRQADAAEQKQDSVTTAPVEEQLLNLLNQLRCLPDSTQGYGPANLIALLRLLRGHLKGLDLSHLSIRGAYLQSIEIQETSLAFALIRDSAFTEAVSATWGVAISKDGTLWAASGMQGEVRVWGEGGRTLHLMWRAHSGEVQALAFGPDGRLLASGSRDGTVKLWDVEACGRGTSPYDALLWMDRHNFSHNLAFSPDGSLLASSGMDTIVPLWDTESGIILQKLEHPANVFEVAWSPDGRLLASACFDGRLRLWERRKTEPLPSTRILSLQTSWETSPVASLAFAPDSRTLASSGWEDRKVKLWEVGSGRLLHTFEGETNQVSRVVWSPDRRTLAGCSYEKAIRLFDIDQRRHRATLSGHTSDINGMAFTPDSGRLLSSSDDGTLRVWDVESGQCVRVVQGYAVSLFSLDWSPDGRYLVSGGTDGCVSIWDTGAETSPGELRGHSWVVEGVGWSPDGKFVASSSWDRVMRLWDPTSHTCVQRFEVPPTILLGMAWSPDGSLLAVGTFLQGMYVWDMRERCPHWVAEPGRTAFFSAGWSPDGNLLAGGSDDGNVYLWESADGILRARLEGHHGHVMDVVWSPDGRLLASCSSNGELFVWDMRREERVQSFMGHEGQVPAVAWSRSGDRLISGGSDGKLRWWGLQNRECMRTLEAHRGTIRSLKVSPDGTRLASCGGDGAIKIWDLESCEQAQGAVPTAPPLLRTLRRDRPYERLNITGIRGLNEAQKDTLRALGAIEDTVQQTSPHG